MIWLQRWRRMGYRELWHQHFGGAHEGDKGCQREYDFMLEVTSGWKHAYESERSLRLEAESVLMDNDIEPPFAKRNRELIERLNNAR